MTKSKPAAHGAALFTVICWGITMVASKQLLTVYSPIQIMVMRFILAIAALFLLRPKFLKLPWKHELGCAALGILGCTLYFLAENTVLQYTLAANVSILIAAAPIFTALLARFTIGGEPFHRNLMIGFFIAIAGVTLTVFNGAVVLHLNPLGDALSLVAAIFWSIYCVMLKFFVSRYDTILISRRTMFYGLLSSLPYLVWEGRAFPFSALVDWRMLISILFLGLLGSALCYIFWRDAVKSLGVVVTNNYLYGIPFVTLVAAAICLGEPISWMGVIGACLTVFGVFLSDRKPT